MSGTGQIFISGAVIQSMVKVYGFLTDPININRGIRQGYPLSALLYILVAEVCAIAIGDHKKMWV